MSGAKFPGKQRPLSVWAKDGVGGKDHGETNSREPVVRRAVGSPSSGLWSLSVEYIPTRSAEGSVRGQENKHEIGGRGLLGRL